MHKTKIFCHQEGMAVLGMVLIILFLGTMAILYTTKTSIKEQQISTNKHRADQSFSAANAGLDWAIDYFDETHADICLGNPCVRDNVIDYTQASPYLLTLSSTAGLSTTAEVYFISNDRSDPTNPKKTPLTIISKGSSDDRTGQHTMSVDVKVFNVFGDGTLPSFPVIIHGDGSATGNVTVVNRYTNQTIWTGGDISLSGTASTYIYIADPTSVDFTCPEEINDGDIYTRLDCISPDVSKKTIQTTASITSQNSSAINSDVIDKDDNLLNMSDDEFFRNFYIGDKAVLAQLAEDASQRFPDPAQYGGQIPTWAQLASANISGVVWIDADGQRDIDAAGTWNPVNPGKDTVGSEGNPITLIVDGEFDASGMSPPLSVDLIGILYTTGNVDKGSNLTIQGTLISEGDFTGSGGPTVIYDREIFSGSLGSRPGDVTAVDPGTWKDWNPY